MGVASMSAQDFVDAFAGVREFRRLRHAGIVLEGGWRLPLAALGHAAAPGPPSPPPAGEAESAAETLVFDRLETLFVDPPRAGLDATVMTLSAPFSTRPPILCLLPDSWGMIRVRWKVLLQCVHIVRVTENVAEMC